MAQAKRRKIMAEIKQLGSQIAKEFKPEKIILFGSHAYGEPHEGSDIDLLVIMPYDGGHAKQAIKILNTIGGFAPLDLLVRTPDEVAQRIEMGDFFIREITERGKILYAADHAGMDRKS